jgi:hypothetical protein
MKVGDIVDLPPVDAIGAIHRGRAERIKEQAAAASPGPMTIHKPAEPEAEPVTEPAVAQVEPPAAPVLGKKRKSAGAI